MENRYLCTRMRQLNNEIRRCLDRNTRSFELDSFTSSNKWIIAHLYEAELEGASVYQRDLEREFGITRSTASKVLILLEKKGMVRREGVSHDARLKKIILTEKSREISKTMHESAMKMERGLINGLTDEELDTLFGYLDRIQKNLEVLSSRKE